MRGDKVLKDRATHAPARVAMGPTTLAQRAIIGMKHASHPMPIADIRSRGAAWRWGGAQGMTPGDIVGND